MGVMAAISASAEQKFVVSQPDSGKDHQKFVVTEKNPSKFTQTDSSVTEKTVHRVIEIPLNLDNCQLTESSFFYVKDEVDYQAVCRVNIGTFIAGSYTRGFVTGDEDHFDAGGFSKNGVRTRAYRWDAGKMLVILGTISSSGKSLHELSMEEKQNNLALIRKNLAEGTLKLKVGLTKKMKEVVEDQAPVEVQQDNNGAF